MARRRFHVGYAASYAAAHILKQEHLAKEEAEGSPAKEYQVRRRRNNFEVVVRLNNHQSGIVENARKENGYTKRKRNRKRHLPQV